MNGGRVVEIDSLLKYYSLKKQQHEILVRRRMNSNAERMKETPEQREFRKTQRKTQTARKTQRKTEVQRKTEIEKKTETPSKTTPTTAARPISPLAVDSSSQKTRKTKLTFGKLSCSPKSTNFSVKHLWPYYFMHDIG